MQYKTKTNKIHREK